MRERLARIETKLDMLIAEYAARVADHETRIRGLEKWRYALPVSVVVAVGSMVTAFMHN